MQTKTILKLDDSLFYGKGSHKKCFIHPENTNLCIKVAYNKGGTKGFIA